MEKDYETIIKEESSKFSTEETFIVNYFDDEGRDHDEEYFTFEDAVEGLRKEISNYESLSGSSFNSLMSSPTLSHPNGSGQLWNYEMNKWE